MTDLDFVDDHTLEDKHEEEDKEGSKKILMNFGSPQNEGVVDEEWINTKSRKNKNPDVGGNTKVGKMLLKESRIKETTRDVVAGKQRTLDSLDRSKSKKK